MTANEKLTSVPAGIRAACVVDGYLVLLGMAFAMIGLSDMSERGFFEYSFLSLDGIAWVILLTMILVVSQLYIIGGIWQIKPWAWTAGVAMLAAQALLFGGVLIWVQLNSEVPVSYADGHVRWLVPLALVVACLAYLFDQRSWYV